MHGARVLFCDGWKLERIQKKLFLTGRCIVFSGREGVCKVELLCIKLSIHFVREVYRIAPYNNGSVSREGVEEAENLSPNVVCLLL